MTIGIYLLSFKNTSKVYIGQSERSIEKRFAEHCRAFYRGTHSPKLNAAYLAFGMPECEILETCIPEDLDRLENYHIKLWNAVDDGFNTMREACGGTSSGEDNGTSIYTDDQYITTFLYLNAHPELSLASVSENLDISYGVVKSMALGLTQKWLSLKYPKEYAELLDRKGTRNNKGEKQGSSTFSNKQIIEALLLQYNNPNMTYQEIADTVGVTKGVVSVLCTGKEYLWIAADYPHEHSTVLSRLVEKRAYSRSASARGIAYPPIISPIGVTYLVENVSAFAKQHGLDTGALNKLLNSKSQSVKGWKQVGKMPA